MKASGPYILIRPGNYWCDRHWKEIEDSQAEDYPIDPFLAAMGLAAGLHLAFGDELERPVANACEMVPSEIMEGIFERSRGWVPAHSLD